MSTPETIGEDDPKYREKVRAFYFTRWYNGYVHFGFTNLLVIGGIATALWLMDGVRPLELLTLPVAFLAANFVEWFAHKGPMHHRTWFTMLFDRHTLVHHVYFPHQDMAVKNHQDWLYVLFPSFAIILVFATATPMALLAGFLFGTNVGCLFFIVAIGYYLLYEWLHLIYHLPEDSWLGGSRIVAALRHHHVIHHHRRLMTHYNFNITFPIFDYLLGTAWREKQNQDGGEGAEGA